MRLAERRRGLMHCRQTPPRTVRDSAHSQVFPQRHLATTSSAMRFSLLLLIVHFFALFCNQEAVKRTILLSDTRCPKNYKRRPCPALRGMQQGQVQTSLLSVASLGSILPVERMRLKVKGISLTLTLFCVRYAHRKRSRFHGPLSFSGRGIPWLFCMTSLLRVHDHGLPPPDCETIVYTPIVAEIWNGNLRIDRAIRNPHGFKKPCVRPHEGPECKSF